MFKQIATGLLLVGGVATVMLSSQIIETLQSGHYQIKQAAISGEMSIHSSEGTYFQNFGSIYDYKLTGEFDAPVPVRFKDGSTADVHATVVYRLPIDDKGRLKLHREYRSFRNVASGLVPTAVQGTMKQTANLFGAEEVYSTRRSEFVSLFADQLSQGLFKTKQGKNTNEVVRGKDGVAEIIKPSIMSEYGITVVNVEINDIDFDSKTDALIAARKDAEQQETLARAEAERSKQDAISAEEKGKANVAKAKYEALVIKEREVIEAEKRTAMEVEKTKQALEQAAQEKAKGEAEAYSAKLKVAAGLSPREQAEIDRDTAIGVAKAMAGVKFPSVMVLGNGGEGDSQLNPFDAVGLKAFQDMAKASAQGQN